MPYKPTIEGLDYFKTGVKLADTDVRYLKLDQSTQQNISGNFKYTGYLYPVTADTSDVTLMQWAVGGGGAFWYGMSWDTSENAISYHLFTNDVLTLKPSSAYLRGNVSISPQARSSPSAQAALIIDHYYHSSVLDTKGIDMQVQADYAWTDKDMYGIDMRVYQGGSTTKDCYGLKITVANGINNYPIWINSDTSGLLFGTNKSCAIYAGLDTYGNGPNLILSPGYMRFLITGARLVFTASYSTGMIFFGANDVLSSYVGCIGDNYTQMLVGLYDSFIFCDKDAVGTSWGHTSVSNPCLYIQSANEASTSDYIAFYHDQTDARILSGKGHLKITLPDAAGATKLKIIDSGNNEVASIDSDGIMQPSGYKSSDGTAGSTGTQVVVTGVDIDGEGHVTNITTKTITTKNGLTTGIA